MVNTNIGDGKMINSILGFNSWCAEGAVEPLIGKLVCIGDSNQSVYLENEITLSEICNDKGFLFEGIDNDIDCLNHAASLPIWNPGDPLDITKEYLVLSINVIDLITKNIDYINKQENNEKKKNIRDILRFGWHDSMPIKKILPSITCNYIHLMLRTVSNGMNSLVDMSTNIFKIKKATLIAE